MTERVNSGREVSDPLDRNSDPELRAPSTNTETGGRYWIRNFVTAQDEGRDSEHVGDGRQAPVPDETVTLLPELSLEDRLLVALSRRGSLRIGQLIENAVGGTYLDEAGVTTHRCFFYKSDEAFVVAVEREAEGRV